jgi:ABC-type cobalamin/Fe3+-siderophores transport system ATPase subunit
MVTSPQVGARDARHVKAGTNGCGKSPLVRELQRL